MLQQLPRMSNLGFQQQIFLLLQLLIGFTIMSPDAHLLACLCCQLLKDKCCPLRVWLTCRSKVIGTIMRTNDSPPQYAWANTCLVAPRLLYATPLMGPGIMPNQLGTVLHRPKYIWIEYGQTALSVIKSATGCLLPSEKCWNMLM